MKHVVEILEYFALYYNTPYVLLKPGECKQNEHSEHSDICEVLITVGPNLDYSFKLSIAR